MACKQYNSRYSFLLSWLSWLSLCVSIWNWWYFLLSSNKPHRRVEKYRRLIVILCSVSSTKTMRVCLDSISNFLGRQNNVSIAFWLWIRSGTQDRFSLYCTWQSPSAYYVVQRRSRDIFSPLYARKTMTKEKILIQLKLEL